MALADSLVLAGALSPDARVRAAVDAHYDAVWRFLRRMGVAERDAEDAAQQVLIVLCQRIAAVAEGAERGFLFGTALRVAADYRKKRGRRRETAVDDDRLLDHEHPAPGPLAAIVERERLACLDKALEAMPPELREVFVLADIEELTMAEIAQVLSIPPGTVASRLRRARAAFEANALAVRASLQKGTRS